MLKVATCFWTSCWVANEELSPIWDLDCIFERWYMIFGIWNLTFEIWHLLSVCQPLSPPVHEFPNSWDAYAAKNVWHGNDNYWKIIPSIIRATAGIRPNLRCWELEEPAQRHKCRFQEVLTCQEVSLVPQSPRGCSAPQGFTRMVSSSDSTLMFSPPDSTRKLRPAGREWRRRENELPLCSGESTPQIPG